MKSIRDISIAAQVYAKQAKDSELIDRATDIRMRAEIKAGELLFEMKKRGERQAAGGDRKSKSQPAILKLDDIGVSATQSSRWQALASMPKGQQEDKIERAKRKAKRALDGTAKRERQETRRGAGLCQTGQRQ